MRFRIWPFVGNAFCVLLALMTLAVWEVLHKMQDLDARTARVHLVYQRADKALAGIRANVYRASLLIREAVPSASPARSDSLRQQLSGVQTATSAGLQQLLPLLGDQQRMHIEHLRQELTDYWNSQTAILGEVGRGGVPGPQILADKDRQRERILEIAGQMDELNAANNKAQADDVAQRALEFRSFLRRTALFLLLLGASIAGGATFYLSRIERLASEQKRRAERAEFELRRLSNQLVHAQEAERKSISRELHDEVGQILTGLRLELASLPSSEPQRLDSVKALAEQALKSVRNLALLLRPSMLDDLGLPAALRWQAKEFTRRTGVNASVRLSGEFDSLPDAHRTCLYRVIQEATTNIARHANAKNAVISLSKEKDLLSAWVHDDGQGFEKNGFRTRGLGLVGMEERARELQGRVTIESHPGQGTTVKVELPLPEGISDKTE